MMVIGVAAYQKAASGMQEKYQESTMQTINMINEYIEMSNAFIETEAMKYAFDGELNKYALGMLDNDMAAKAEVLSATKSNIISVQTANEFVSNIHLITKPGAGIITTKSSGVIGAAEMGGFLDEYLADVPTDGKLPRKWIDRHDMLDTNLKLETDDYILSYQLLSQNKSYCVVVDVKADSVRTLMEGINLGEGSVLGLVTEGGRELLCEKISENGISILDEGTQIFYGQDYFSQIDEEENANGSMEIKYKGNEYLFIYSRSNENHATVCAMVPMKVITGQAEEIKILTATLVVLATAIASIIGIWIAAGIQGNMKHISRRFGEVSQGDLTVRITAKGKDEFQKLAASAENMIENNKKLVTKVSDSTSELENSACEVKETSGTISHCSEEMVKAITNINEGVERQSVYAQICMDKTAALSADMLKVSNTVEQVGCLVKNTEKMIEDGMTMVMSLGKKAKATNEITVQVGENIAALKKETGLINQFVETIAGISKQTNLLSLNASIEAARAGESGKGFAVVAEEIRKLADDSAKAAGEIQNNVTQINERTLDTVNNAKHAEEMVASQTEVVEKVVAVFKEMSRHMQDLVVGLNAIVNSTEKADTERKDTLDSVQNISGVIEENVENVRAMNKITEKLHENVENLNHISEILNQNMEGLKGEISVFKVK
ncbi:MAG: methyl-accepting chemotaxis protein [Lachnospiraceae bacterium]|nr:methyl-accepting chemotaxis protein [Lachnospiraceae bacterium]